MVYVFLADGFEEIEALTPVDILRRAGETVVTVGVTGKTVKGSHGITVEADRLIGETGDASDADMIVLPGGMPGAANLDASAEVENILLRAAERDAYIAAICAAPMIPGKRGLLSGRDATCYPGFEKYLDGAKYYDASVVVDGNFITSDGMGSALDFALQLVALLKGDDAADSLAESVRA